MAAGLGALEFTTHSTWVNLTVFTGALAAVWFGGAKLARYADVIADRSGIGDAFAGLLLLGGATSLPELATTLSAAAGGAAELATANLLGGVAMQTAVLAVADFFCIRGALTFFTPRAVLLAHGVMLIVLLALAIAAGAIGDFGPGPIGILTIVIGGAYVGMLYLVHRYEHQRAWEPVNPPEAPDDDESLRAHLRGAFASTSVAGVLWRFAGAALLVAAGGWLVAGTGEAIAVQTGLSESFVGATLVAVSTSLPELSTTIAAVRFGAFGMAVSNVFGGNAIDVALLLAADLAYTDGPIMSSMSPATMLTASMGIILTCVYLWGLLERRDRSLARLGYDSLAVAGLYAIGIVAVYLIG